MEVLLINGSPKSDGCTFTALSEVARALQKQDINTTFFHLGSQPLYGCTACGKCAESKRCVLPDSKVNECIERLEKADAVVVGSPVYYAAPNGALCALLDRVFLKSKLYAYKPAAAIVTCRRGGASAAFDRLNKYFTISCMPVVSSQYWNAVHGSTPDEIHKDLEGMQIMHTLGTNMAWLLHCIHKAALPKPNIVEWHRTDFHHD